ncbi:iron transporter [Boudabousia liubingyangii]|uniref:Iron transporter n=1 Tax=Boudabousia liubingyangii TaxID=1921764 RepID=A0A1Q5PLQ7_9ACTO|nr:iron uptake transporter permease EfeU [Boudabousia liubingyangii]OKL46903.1 iron transporter [Boudabousia liubingyangii]OKL47988.1 iron transporter [Boudabousia liubingyangii]
MYYNAFIGNFVIALRESVEASLVVGILVAYLVKAGRKDILPKMWAGVAAATAIPLLGGAYLTWSRFTMKQEAQEAMGGYLSLIAAAFVTWMMFWMTAKASDLSGEVKNAAGKALATGSSWAIVWLAIFSVGREGLETALFVMATIQSSAASAFWIPTLGMLAGIAAGIFVGWLVYRGSRQINLRLFFKLTGFLLIFVAAGILSYGIGDLQEANILPGHGVALYDLSQSVYSVISPNSWWWAILEAMFNVQLAPTALQVIAWCLYVGIALPVFLIVMRRGRATSQPKRKATIVAPVAASETRKTPTSL